eukprot:CAMPEP_0179487508 /NCGR_PEP_ID=MMETSP0799-20121207/63460_1 /TAXON_ID=46947 /ORGANISM="Geminigera cryophila, Strain CCMP2564" /LENGTH=84 /DNA_ID=CAMNT_0021302633 /DNA_START=389 /DNA_END=646 /DNA_ORIENTATION=+
MTVCHSLTNCCKMAGCNIGNENTEAPFQLASGPEYYTRSSLLFMCIESPPRHAAQEKRKTLPAQSPQDTHAPLPPPHQLYQRPV